MARFFIVILPSLLHTKRLSIRISVWKYDPNWRLACHRSWAILRWNWLCIGKMSYFYGHWYGVLLPRRGLGSCRRHFGCTIIARLCHETTLQEAAIKSQKGRQWFRAMDSKCPLRCSWVVFANYRTGFCAKTRQQNPSRKRKWKLSPFDWTVLLFCVVDSADGDQRRQLPTRYAQTQGSRVAAAGRRRDGETEWVPGLSPLYIGLIFFSSGSVTIPSIFECSSPIGRAFQLHVFHNDWQTFCQRKEMKVVGSTGVDVNWQWNRLPTTSIFIWRSIDAVMAYQSFVMNTIDFSIEVRYLAVNCNWGSLVVIFIHRPFQPVNTSGQSNLFWGTL